jgi:hypothetical protein
MKSLSPVPANTYRESMGQLLVLYTQVDRLIMEICAERIGTAPDEAAKLALAKQVGDESRHVMIQQKWMSQFGTDTTPIITNDQECLIRAHFRDLPWLEFLADLYLGVEALGSEAVENIVPLADPGTRESLHVPREQRAAILASIPQRIEDLTCAFHGFGMNVADLFSNVGANYEALCDAVLKRRDEVLEEVAA